MPWIAEPPPKVSKKESNIVAGNWPIDPTPGIQVNSQVLAKEPDMSNIGAKKLNSIARNKERRKFDDTIGNLTRLMAETTQVLALALPHIIN